MQTALSKLKLLAIALLAPIFNLVTMHMQRGGLILGAYAFPEGSKFYYSTTFASAKTLATMSNANPTVAGSVAHGYVDADIVLLNSGWEDAADTLWKVDQLTVDTFSLLGLNTSDTSFYSANGGDNSTTQKVSTWVEIPQVLTIASSGGDPRYTTINPIARRNSINVPTGFNPTSITLTIGHDASNATYQAMLGISRSLSKVAFKMALSGGAVTYGYGYMATSEVPSMNVNQANQVTVALSLLGRSISYAS